MNAPEYFTPEVRRRALAYTLAVSRGDPYRSQALAGLSEDELERTVEALAMLHAASLQKLTGDAENVLMAWLGEITDDENDNTSQEDSSNG